MSRLRLRFSVSGEDVIDDVKDAIEDGIKSSAADIAFDAEKQATRVLIEENLIWRGNLVGSFDWYAVDTGDGGLKVIITNDAEHAPTHEFGWPSHYRRPPIESLVPWVESEMQGWVVMNGRLFPDGDGDGSGGTADVAFEPVPTEPTDFTGTTDFQEMDQTRVNRILGATSDVENVADLGKVSLLTDQPDPEDDVGTMIAAAVPIVNDDNELISSEALFLPDDFKDSYFDTYGPSGTGRLVARDIEEGTYHELVHTVHFDVMTEEKSRLPSLHWPGWVDEDLQDKIADEISTYAAANPSEFVAEVGTLLLTGREDQVSDEMMGLYSRFRGPDLPDVTS